MREKYCSLNVTHVNSPRLSSFNEFFDRFEIPKQDLFKCLIFRRFEKLK